MRVSIVTGVFPPQRCGIGDYTDCLAKHLTGLGIEVHIVTSRCELDNTCPPNVHRVVGRWNSTGIARVMAVLDDIRQDIVHIQFPSVGYQRTVALPLLPVLLRIAGFKVVLTLHEYVISRRISRLRQLLMASAAHRVITTNPEDYHLLTRLLFWKKQHIQRIGIGANIEPDAAAVQQFNRESRRRSFGATGNSHVICFFGNIYPAKGIEELIDAFGIVCKSLADAKLVIIGSSDSGNTLFSSLIRRKIIDSGLVDRVYVSGFVPKQQVSELLLASDLCVLPFRDGISMRRGSFLAAVKHGLPVVTTAPTSQPPDNLIDGENVMFVSPGDVEKLADSIVRLLNSPETYIRMKQNTVALGQKFSWSEIAEQTLRVYQTL